MTELDQAHLSARALKLVRERLVELIGTSTPLARRARTLSPRSAVRECCALARAKVRSGGVTRPSADPLLAGHNIAMLPDLVRETVGLVRADEVLRHAQPELIDLLCGELERFPHAEFREEGAILKVEAFTSALDRSYLEDAGKALREIVANSPKELFSLEAICRSVVSELRTRGWSDGSLADAFASDTADLEQLLERLASLDIAPVPYQCFVAVTVSTHRAEITESRRVSFVDALPVGDVVGPLPPRAGPYASVCVDAVDYRYAAEAAYSRIASLLGAAAVFVKTDMLVRSSIVVVQVSGALRGVDAHVRLPRESRSAKAGQLARIVRSASDAAETRSVDSIFEAIRHRQRAIEASDLESRFMLLWLGIERLCIGSPDHTTILDSVRSLVPPAIALGKLRREVSALRSRLARSASRRGQQEHRTLPQLVDLVRDSNARALTSEFYEDDVLACQWVARLQKDLREANGKSVAKYFERSRERVEWQVLRLYRARNSVAHAARGPAWLTDLVLHAHFYLTQLIAICVDHRDEGPSRSGATILLHRAAQYSSFIDLLRSENPRARETDNLLRPTALLG